MTRLINADAFIDRIKETKDGGWFKNGYTDLMIDNINDEPTCDIKDDYHTMNELYQHRHILLAGFVNLLYQTNISAMCDIFKSRFHSDGTMFDDMFIVMGYLNGKQFSYHVENKYWELFNIPYQEKSDEWNGHAGEDVIGIIEEWIRGEE